MLKLLPLCFLCLLAAANAVAPLPKTSPQEREVSLTSRVLTEYEPNALERGGAAARVAAVRALIAALPKAQRAELSLTLDDPERANWTNTPPGRDEKGLRLGDCAEVGLKRACDLLATALSPAGYARARDILLGDDLLLRGGRPRAGFGAENFWLMIFGEPSIDGEWGLQLDGHHLALNLSFKGEAMTMSPSFLGAQPSKFERGEQTIEPLADPVSAAFALVGSMTESQLEAAVVGEHRGPNVAAAGRDGFVPEPEGIECSLLGEVQLAHARTLVESVIRDLPAAAAKARLKALEQELPRMHFAWRGPTEPGSDVSFRLQGPTLILEYACQDLGGDPLDHLHLMYRDPTNEYGAGL